MCPSNGGHLCFPETVWVQLQVCWLDACSLKSSMFKGNNNISRLAKSLAMTLPVTLRRQQMAPSEGMAGLCADLKAIVSPTQIRGV